ncbi:VOC family protein [Nocardioides sp. cx-173]|uniref:VOC family protein n=1 Tax=Nocardioides sp. cx-173 TaxID=2898796 RepID=UPI001E35AACF|nr:VOC family protein [Nocardioides sp. cx-173]MCD4525013.1 VOC family protein [Nocardioides sp. cx-173]UGB40279.1 VOC family protein [Nocardioides sp. cx-173]
MALHRLTSITVGVPNVAETAAYYADFGLEPLGGNVFATADGGEQFRLVHADRRRLVEIGIGAEDPDDLARIERQLRGLDLGVERTGAGSGARLVAEEPIAGFRAVISVAPRIDQQRIEPTRYNGPGRVDRANTRARGILREGAVTPRKLGHVVIGSTDQAATQRFFTEGIGFKVSDVVPSIASFMRCSTDHHNVLVQQAPVNFLHHTSWQVEDVDEVGRGAMSMLEGNPERHVWGLGRHHVGSNFFWYLKDPAGNFSEYYSDIDCIVDDALWEPGTWEGAKGLFSWGPPPPPSFVMPEDVAAMMTGAHSAG